jgi:hypothetical protein
MCSGWTPITLRWTRIELTAAMDWYTRCIVGLRLTPVSTKAVDAAAMMYRVYRPPPAPAELPDNAVWPHHGIPRIVCIDLDLLVTTRGKAVCGPAATPETIVVRPPFQIVPETVISSRVPHLPPPPRNRNAIVRRNVANSSAAVSAMILLRDHLANDRSGDGLG